MTGEKMSEATGKNNSPDVKIEKLDNGRTRIVLETTLTGNLMDVEEGLVELLNRAGAQAMTEALEHHDVDGESFFLNLKGGPPKDDTRKATKQASGKRK